MPDAYKNKRYSHSDIKHFVEGQDRIDQTALVTQQIQSDELFMGAASKPEGPVDLLYRFVSEDHQKPALGFQQVDGEGDAEPMYTLVYLDPALTPLWDSQLKHE